MNQENYWSKVERRNADECWLWTGCKNTKGYGQFRSNGRTRLATHVALELDGLKRPPSPANCALHSDACVSRACVNPSHLRWGTQRENMADMGRLGRGKTPRLKGAEHPMAVLSGADIASIRAAPKVRGSGRALARQYGVTEGTIWRIRSGRLWRVAA